LKVVRLLKLSIQQRLRLTVTTPNSTYPLHFSTYSPPSFPWFNGSQQLPLHTNKAPRAGL